MSFLIRNIHFDLSPGGVQKAIDEVNYIRDRLAPAMARLIDTLAEKGVKIARSEIIHFDNPAYDTGQLSESIQMKPCEDHVGKVFTNCEYAMYVEFGTGIGFDGNNAIGVGRVGTPDHLANGWVYFNDRTGQWTFTRGMAARPFMQNTFEDLFIEAAIDGGRLIAEYIAE